MSILNSTFNRTGEFRQYIGGSVSWGTLDILKRRLQIIAAEFSEMILTPPFRV